MSIIELQNHQKKQKLLEKKKLRPQQAQQVSDRLFSIFMNSQQSGNNNSSEE